MACEKTTARQLFSQKKMKNNQGKTILYDFRGILKLFVSSTAAFLLQWYKTLLGEDFLLQPL